MAFPEAGTIGTNCCACACLPLDCVASIVLFAVKHEYVECVPFCARVEPRIISIKQLIWQVRKAVSLQHVDEGWCGARSLFWFLLHPARHEYSLRSSMVLRRDLVYLLKLSV
jgi:hypothetical protein